MKLEQIETIKLAHPFNKGFDKVHFCATEDEAIRVANGEVRSVGNQDGVKTVETDLNDQNGDSESKEEDDSKVKVYTTTYYIGLEINTGKSIPSRPHFEGLCLVSIQKSRGRSTSLGPVRNSLTCAKVRNNITTRNKASTLL